MGWRLFRDKKIFDLQTLSFWLLLAAFIRLISALSHSSYHHPDEWYQTVEFAQMIVNGHMSFTHEVGLHLRNLSWPLILSGPLAIGNSLFSHWIGAHVFTVQATAAFFSLTAVWGWAEVWKSFLKPLGQMQWFPWLMGLFVLSWFSAADAIRPSQENLSSICFWLSAGLICRRQWLWAGLFTVGIGAMKYPAGLLSLGLLLNTGILFWRKDKTSAALKKYIIGLAIGFFAFGLADWIFYGRPWESLWMYLQYNVFTGLSSKNFGTQPATVYWEFFKGHWTNVMVSIGIISAIGFVPATIRYLRSGHPLILPSLLYLLGHLLIGHKEPRFMVPIEFSLIAIGLMGFLEIILPRLKSLVRSIWVPQVAVLLLLITFIGNSGRLLREVWGQNWVAQQTYFEITRHMRNFPHSCAIVTVRRPQSIHFPKFARDDQVPNPAFAYFPNDRRAPSFKQVQERPLIWLSGAPECRDKDQFLIHLHKPDPEWLERGCTLLRSGILAWTPRIIWPWLIKKRISSGPWYSCSTSLLKDFPLQEQRQVLVHGIGKHPRLPPLGIAPDQLVEMGNRSIRTKPRPADGTLGDW